MKHILVTLVWTLTLLSPCYAYNASKELPPAERNDIFIGQDAATGDQIMIMGGSENPAPTATEHIPVIITPEINWPQKRNHHQRKHSKQGKINDEPDSRHRQ